MKIVKDDILNSGKNIIIQQVNCQGVMGKGLALYIYTKYPEVKEEYLKHTSKILKTKSPYQLLGEVLYVTTSDCTIANVYGQERYRKTYDDDGIVYTSESHLLVGIYKVLIHAEKYNLSVAIPVKIGCGLAGGDWSELLPKLERLVTLMNVDVTLYEKD